jgi:hypothetical protein
MAFQKERRTLNVNLVVPFVFPDSIANTFLTQYAALAG